MFRNASFLFHTNDVAYGVQKALNENIYGTRKKVVFGSENKDLKYLQWNGLTFDKENCK